jgi:glycosyltransferase involved in cell wall biosynthesis
MRVSVVIPTYNSAALVVGAVESVLAQTRPADEVIVVDDGSTDDTAERLSRFGAPVRVIRKENGGVSSARNRGVAESSGELVAFLDADDVWHPRKLEIQVGVLESRPDLGLLGTKTYEWPVINHQRLESSEAQMEGVPLDDLVVSNRLVTSTILARASVLREAGPFDLDLRGPEDHDLWIRIAQRALVAILPLALTGYRAATPGSLSKNATNMEVGMRAILAKLEEGGVFRRRPILRRKAWAHFRYSCGLMYREAGYFMTAANRFARSLASWPFPLCAGDDRRKHRLFALLVTIRKMLTGARQRPRIA